MYKVFCNPCIIQTIIICSTIVVLAHIGVCAYRIKKQEKVKERSWASYIYGASILLTLSVVIFSYFYHKEVNVLDFISLSSAIISIILAVVTIIYSYHINSESRGQIENLNKAAADVSEATKSYSESSQKLDENIQKIIDSVTRVEETTNRIENYIADSANSDNNSSSESANSTETDKYISSTLGMTLLYGMILSKDKNKALDLTSIFKKVEIVYCIGFFIATKSAKLIDGKINLKEGKKEIQLKYYKDSIRNSVYEWIMSSNNEFVRTTKEHIDKYFDV